MNMAMANRLILIAFDKLFIYMGGVKEWNLESSQVVLHHAAMCFIFSTGEGRTPPSPPHLESKRIPRLRGLYSTRQTITRWASEVGFVDHPH